MHDNVMQILNFQDIMISYACYSRSTLATTITNKIKYFFINTPMKNHHITKIITAPFDDNALCTKTCPTTNIQVDCRLPHVADRLDSNYSTSTRSSAGSIVIIALSCLSWVYFGLEFLWSAGFGSSGLGWAWISSYCISLRSAFLSLTVLGFTILSLSVLGSAPASLWLTTATSIWQQESMNWHEDEK